MIRKWDVVCICNGDVMGFEWRGAKGTRWALVGFKGGFCGILILDGVFLDTMFVEQVYSKVVHQLAH